MSYRLNKCSDHQILTILDDELKPDNEEPYSDKSNEKENLEIQNALNSTLNTSSSTENIFKNAKYALQKHTALQQKKDSLKIKLRRSTEQSLYKIDTDSENEKPLRKSCDQYQKQRKKSYSEVESEGSYSDKDNSTKYKASNSKNLTKKSNKYELLRRNRIRRPPLRFSYYHCESLTPSLRTRKNINYDEDTLLINSIISNVKDKKKLMIRQENKTSDNSIDKHNLEPKHSNVKSNKRNRIPSTKGEETNSDADFKTLKAKSPKKSSRRESIINDKLDHIVQLQEMTEKQDLLILAPINDTPVKSTKQKRVCENTPRKVQYVDNDNNHNEDEYLIDTHKHTKISSTVKNSTPIRIDKQKKIVSEHTQTSVQFDNKNDSNEEEESISDMYKRIKISSVKKKNLTPQKRNSVQKNLELHLEETHLSTPKSRSIKCSNLTPSLRKRNSTLLKPATPLQEARSRLHVSAVPKSLPCREEEFNNIFSFLKGKLEDKSGGCIYISGVPGTGKTATVNEAVRCLQKLIIKGQLDDFDYVAINGMKLTEPRQAYVQILKQLDDKTATWEQSYHILEKRFHSTTSKMTLLLVDELDFLCTKRQDVVYNLLDWPTKSTAQLVLITIANTMDLPERVLMGRVTSRLGLTRLTFQPYNHKQLQEIVTSRLKDFSGFRNEAIQLVARKVSAVSGDARRALDICRRAMEITESRGAEAISLQDVTEAVTEMIASAKVQAIKHCSKMEQIFLQVISAEVTRTSIEEVYFKDAYKQLESFCSFDGIEVPTVTEILAVCGRLSANRLLICEHSRNDIYQKILLNVSTDDVHYAVQELDLSSM